MDKRKVINTVKKYAELVRRDLRFEKIYLFGSYVHGKPKAYSDIDIGIIVKQIKGDYLATMKKLYKLRRQIDVRIEPHLIIEDADMSGFGEEVKRTGIAI